MQMFLYSEVNIGWLNHSTFFPVKEGFMPVKRAFSKHGGRIFPFYLTLEYTLDLPIVMHK